MRVIRTNGFAQRGFYVLGAVVSALCGLGCRDNPAGPSAGDDVVTRTSALTTPPLSAAAVMGFEAPNAWTASAFFPIRLDTDRQQGAFSIAFSPKGYTPITSVPVGSVGAASSALALDIKIPSPQVNTFWYGAVQIFVTIPSLNFFNGYVGQVELTGSPLDAWRTLLFTVPPDILTKLLGTYSDLTFTIVVNVPQNAQGDYRLDDLRFLPLIASACASAPNGTLCDDGDQCTQTSVCQGGTCVGSNVKACPADACHTAGVCQPTSGICTKPRRPTGTPCNDGNQCTQNDFCEADTCVGHQLAPMCVPGLVMGLMHNQNQAPAGTKMFSALHTEATHRDGGDLGADNHRGYEWWSLADSLTADPAAVQLPPGVVTALRHSANQSSQFITAFGHNPVTGTDFTGFRRQIGGDLGAPNGVGYFWYESTGAGFTNWAAVDGLLPKYTVVGLKHSANQPTKTLLWNGVTYDPVQPSPVPPGFRRVVGGDLGAPNGVGYFWYEKTTGTEIASIPSLRVTLPRNINMRANDPPSADRDGDCLVDSLEATLANAVRPFVKFDSNEIARQDFEPVTVYRLYLTAANTIRIRWVFLFALDGGYGPAASFLCTNSHQGDNDNADFDLTTTDGVTWTISNMTLSFKGLNVFGNSRLEVYDKAFPIVYLSGSKHHEYFTRDADGHDSLYSSVGCDENVNGLGFNGLVDLGSFTGFPSNNVGEPGAPLLNDLSQFFPGMTMWNGELFYSSDAGPNSDKVNTGTGAPALPPPFRVCTPGP